MRRSAAPSQLDGAGNVKRPRFAPPFIGSKTTSDSNLTKPEQNFKSSENLKKDVCHRPSKDQDVASRSAKDILNLINTKKSAESENQNVHCPPVPDRSSDVSVLNTPKPCSTVNEPTATPSQSTRYFSVVWCKLSKKKHKKWEGDAILKVKGNSLTLIDLEGKEIGHGSGYKTTQLQTLEDGNTLIIGGKEIEVMGKLSEEQFTSGSCFLPALEIVVTPSETKKAVAKPFVKPLRSNDNSASTVVRTLAPIEPRPLPANAFVLPRPSDSHQWQYNSSHLPVVDVVVDPHLARHLRPHQREGVVFLYKCVMGMNQGATGMEGGAILADEMGLGKTLQCITLIWTLFKQGPYGNKPVIRKILVISPGSLVKNWVKEFKKWLSLERIAVYAVGSDKKVVDYASVANVPVMIISYEMFVRNVEEIKKIKFDLLVCDEGHRLKNINVKTTMFANSLSIKKRVVLTGTPVQNDLQELFAIVDFCMPGVLGTSGAFRHIYETPILASRQPMASEDEVKLGQTRAAELNRITGRFILRRTSEINNRYLPPKVDIVLFCALSPLQLLLYTKLLGSRAIMSCLRNSTTSDFSQHLCCILALKKLCNHPDLIYQSSLDAAAVQNYERSNDIDSETSLYDNLAGCFPSDYRQTGFRDRIQHGGKLIVLERLLKSFRNATPMERVVVVSNYTKTLDLIEELCKTSCYQYLRLDGKTATSKRVELVDRFNSSYSQDFVFLLSTKAGGVGLNLIGASRLVLYDVDWNPANDLQAMARVWRDGQRKRTYIYRLLSTGSIEEKIYQRQVSKQGLCGVVVDAKANDNKMTFSPEQLRELFQMPDTSLCSTHDLLCCTCADGTSTRQKVESDTTVKRSCQLQLLKAQKNSCMDELLDWTHLSGPSPDLSDLDPVVEGDSLGNVTFAFWTESNGQINESNGQINKATDNGQTTNNSTNLLH